MEINQLIDKIKHYIKLLIVEKIKYKDEVITLVVKYHDNVDKAKIKSMANIIYSLHNELLYLVNVYKLLSQLYI